MKVAVQTPPPLSDVAAASWSWKSVRQFVVQQYGEALSPQSCWRYLHRLGFVWKRPKRLLLKANAEKRAAFVQQYRALVQAAEQRGARIFFVDEATFRADGDLRGLWVQRGEEALVNSTSPSHSEKANYYGAVCLETGDVAGGDVLGTSDAATSVLFLQRLREQYAGPLIIIWDNAPAHHGEPLREYLKTPDLDVTLVTLPTYSPDYNAAELIWKWIRDEVTANTCFGTATKVTAAVGQWFDDVDAWPEEVKRRCRSELQTAAFPETSQHPARRLRKLELRRERILQAARSM